MGTNTDESATLKQTVTNNILQSTNQVCRTSSNVQITGNAIIVSGGTVKGNVGITANGTQASAACMMSSSMNSNVSTLLSSIAQQSNTTFTDMLGDLSFNNTNEDVDIEQAVTNNITQIMNSTCQTNSNISVSDNYIYVGDANVGGSVGIDVSNSSATSSCTMNNVSSAVAYNQAQASSDQSNTTIGMFALFGLAFVLILIIGGIIVLLFFSGSSRGVSAAPIIVQSGSSPNALLQQGDPTFQALEARLLQGATLPSLPSGATLPSGTTVPSSTLASLESQLPSVESNAVRLSEGVASRAV